MLLDNNKHKQRTSSHYSTEKQEAQLDEKIHLVEVNY